MDVEPDEAVTGIDGRPRVDAHTDADGRAAGPRRGEQRTLCGGRSFHCVGRRVEDGKGLVSAALDLATAVTAEGTAEERPGIREDVPVVRAQAPDERGGALDVGEEERELFLGHARSFEDPRAAGQAASPRTGYG